MQGHNLCVVGSAGLCVCLVCQAIAVENVACPINRRSKDLGERSSLVSNLCASLVEIDIYCKWAKISVLAFGHSSFADCESTNVIQLVPNGKYSS